MPTWRTNLTLQSSFTKFINDDSVDLDLFYGKVVDLYLFYGKVRLGHLCV